MGKRREKLEEAWRMAMKAVLDLRRTPKLSQACREYLNLALDCLSTAWDRVGTAKREPRPSAGRKAKP